MGRQAEIGCSFAGQNAIAKVLLEPDEIILRGPIKARIPRADVSGVGTDGDDLVVQTGQGPLRLTLGTVRAASWAIALTAQPPTLAHKLGIGPDRPAWVLGQVTDPALLEGLAGAQSADPDACAVVLAELLSPLDMEHALNQLRGLPAKPFWGVTIKGAQSPFSDSALRATLRAAGYIDTKSCAVSHRMTATRYSSRP